MVGKWCQRTLLATALALAVQQAWAQDEVLRVVDAKATEKVSGALVAAQQTGGRFIGATMTGRPVVKLSAEQAKRATEQGLSVKEAEAGPGKLDEINELIVIYEPGQPVAQATLQRAGVVKVDEHKEGHFIVVRAAGGITAESVTVLANAPGVTFVEPNYVVRIPPMPEGAGAAAKIMPQNVPPGYVPNDPGYSQLWGMKNIHAESAWNTVRTSPVIVAVIDTGVDYNHPDLAADMWHNPADPIDGKDNDGNGLVDDYYGADYINNDGDPMDDNSHGSHCSGTIGAVGNNGVGVVGVNWSVRIMALKFLGAGGSGSIDDAIKCVDYARTHGARIMSNSWGGGGYVKAMDDAITRAQNAGMLFVAAAGNSNSDNDANAFYPASYTQDCVIAVASIDSTDKKSSFSSYGKTTVDIGAPGGSIYSTVPNSGYGTMSGTSMATPHVSGAAALVSGHPAYGSYNWKSVKQLLMNNARPLSDLSGRCVTGGTLDIAFLEQAVTTILTQEAYNQFNNVKVDKNTTVASVSFTLPTTMFVHFTAQTTAALTKGGPMTVYSGLYTADSPNVVYTYSLRRTKFNAVGDLQPVSTSFGMRLGPGQYTIYWNLWVSGGELTTDSGTIMVEAFGAKSGGILETGEAADSAAPEVSELTKDGKIKRQVTTLEDLP